MGFGGDASGPGPAELWPPLVAMGSVTSKMLPTDGLRLVASEVPTT